MTFTIKQMNSFDLFWRAVQDLIGNRGTRDELALPQQVNNFNLVETLFSERRHNKFQFGLYKDGSGKEYIAKQLSLKNPGMDEYWLRNEISVYAALTDLYKQKNDEIKRQFPDMNIPKLAAVVDDKQRLISFMEKVEGKTLFEVSDEKKMVYMERAIQYFNYLNTIHDFKNDVMTRRSMWHVVTMSVLATIGALIKNGQAARDIIKGELIILFMGPWLLFQREKGLIHRDIGYSNILIGEKENYVIDFELSSYMHPMFEITQMVIGCWNKEGFYEVFSKTETMKKIKSSIKSHTLYKLLTIYSGIHSLATHKKNTETGNKINSLIQYLKYGLGL